MSTAIQLVLSTELTAIPAWIRASFNGHFNNTLCNGAMWMLVLWKVVHILYTELMHRCLKHTGTKQYSRTRLTNSLWYCGFFSLALAYTLVTFDGNKMDFLLRRNHVTLNENLPSQVILAYTVVCTFYLYTALSEGIQCGSWFACLKFILLVAVCISAFMLRVLEIIFSLTSVIAICAISEEITKMFHSLLKQDKFVRSLYIFNVVLFTFTHFLAIPFIFLIPLGKMIRFDTSDPLLILLFSSLLLWLCSAIHNSVIFNAIVHWLYHTTKKSHEEEDSECVEDEINIQTIQCPLTIIECSLFSTRTDDAYLLHVLRSQIRERKKKMDAKKKPKAKSLMLIQTLKCVMAIRKKLNQKRQTDNCDSDDTSENEDNADEDDNAAVHGTPHIDEDDSESTLHINEVKVEHQNDCDVGIRENLSGNSGTGTDEIKVETTDSDVKSTLESEGLQTVEDSKETSGDITATVEATPRNSSDNESQDEQASKPTCDGAKESSNTQMIVGNASAAINEFSEITTSSPIGRDISSESIPDKDKLDGGNALMQSSLHGNNSKENLEEESGKVKGEKSAVKISASFKKSAD